MYGSDFITPSRQLETLARIEPCTGLILSHPVSNWERQRELNLCTGLIYHTQYTYKIGEHKCLLFSHAWLRR